jgi:hypothetical protein
VRLAHALPALLLAAAAAVSAAQTFNPNAPTVPAWTHSIKLPAPDNRTLVTDGRLALEVGVAKPAVRPSTLMPPAAASAFANYLRSSYPTEIGLGDLRASETGNTFGGPNGIVMSSNYVTFLRRNAPRARLRVRAPSDPVIIVLDDRPVGLLMPGG